MTYSYIKYHNTNGKIVTCIDNGVNYAYKELNENKVITGKGTCSYDGTTEDYTDTLNKKVTALQNQISNSKTYKYVTTEDCTMIVVAKTSKPIL